MHPYDDALARFSEQETRDNWLLILRAAVTFDDSIDRDHAIEAWIEAGSMAGLLVGDDIDEEVERLIQEAEDLARVTTPAAPV